MNGPSAQRRRLLPAPSDPTRYVHVELPRCPDCASALIRYYRTTRSDDGSITRHARCECGKRFIVVAE